MLMVPRSNPQVAPQIMPAAAAAPSVNNSNNTTTILPSPSERGVFRIGLVVKDRILPERVAVALSDITSPLSDCQITCVAILEEREASRDLTDQDFLEQYHVHHPDEQRHNNNNNNNNNCLLFGPTAFYQLLNKSNVDAVYILVPPEEQSDYVMAALQAHKHVLLDDLVSTALTDFRQQLARAQQVKRLVQFPTMFAHRHRVQSFLSVVLPEKFGDIQSVDVILTMNYHDAITNLGVSFPLTAGQGAIHRLGRHCALIGALIMTRCAGSLPQSAKITKAAHATGSTEPFSAQGVVKFTDNRVLNFTIGYSGNATRQLLEVKSHHRYATMTDFVIPHPDGLTSYRLYDKELNPVTGKLEIERGEALDVPQGLSQGITMWRHFRRLCNSIEEQGWTESPQTTDVLQLTGVALQTKRILTALEQSLAEDGKEVEIAMEDFNVL